jgi:hypothetical protein
VGVKLKFNTVSAEMSKLAERDVYPSFDAVIVIVPERADTE